MCQDENSVYKEKQEIYACTTNSKKEDLDAGNRNT
jgi:hypothetical protein